MLKGVERLRASKEDDPGSYRDKEYTFLLKTAELVRLRTIRNVSEEERKARQYRKRKAAPGWDQSNFSEVRIEFYFNGKKSQLKAPKSLQLTETKSFDRKLLKGYHQSSSSKKTITINANYSNVSFQ